MKKWLLRIVGIVVILVLIAIGVGFALPSQMQIERSIVIDAPPEYVFAQIDDLRSWSKWQAWNKEMDPTLEEKFEAKTAGVGGERSWTGKKLGDGRQKIVESIPNVKQSTDLWFMGAKDPAHSTFELEPKDKNSKTEVFWSMECDDGGNILCRYMNVMFRGAMEADFDKGLAKLKTVVEKEAKEVVADDPAAVKALLDAGIKVQFDGLEKRVLGVNFGDTNSGDAETVHLQKLTNIQTLSLAVPGVTDKGLENIKGLMKLKTLNLESAAVSDAGMALLRELPVLDTVNLQRTNITGAGFEHLCQIPSIRRLRMSQTNLRDDALAHLKHCPKLVLLDLMDITGLTAEGMKHVGQLKELRTLKLWGNTINDAAMKELGGLKKLEALTLQDTATGSEGLAVLAEMPNLRDVGFFRSVTVNDAAVKFLEGNKNLKILDLRGTQVTSAGLESVKTLPALEDLDLSETLVSDVNLELLASCKNLKALNLWACDVTDDGVKKLEPLKELRRLNLDKTRLTDAGCVHLLVFKNLEFLHVGSTDVKDKGLETLVGLKDCPKLGTLVISHLFPEPSKETLEKLQQALPKTKIES